MAKKATEETKVATTVEETTPVQEPSVETETVKIEEAVAEPTYVPVVIAKTETPLRKIPSLESKYIVGKMNIGVAYTIAKEVSSKIYGDFYLLENGCYITKSGNYTVN